MELLFSVALASIAVLLVSSTVRLLWKAQKSADTMYAVNASSLQLIEQIDCDLTTTTQACSALIDAFDDKGNVVINKDGSTRMEGLRIQAVCVGDEVHLQYRQQDDEPWKNLIPNQVPACFFS